MKILLYIILIVIFLLIGLFIGKKITKIKIDTINKEIFEEERRLKYQILSLQQQKESYEENLKSLQSYYMAQKEQQDKNLNDYYQEKKYLIDNQISQELQFSSEKLKQKIIDLEQKEISQLDKRLEENRLIFESKSSEYTNILSQLASQIEELQIKQQAAIAAAKREEEIKNQTDFYRLQISNEDLTDIMELKAIEKKIIRKDVLNKLIYKVYFEKPYTDLVGRVIGKEVKTGIYKITNLKDKRVYVGQAVNIAERWKQHIKRALGAEQATKNKLYPAMIEDGVWNFTFEIIEICEKKDLNQKEQEWQKFFGAKEFGYSIK